MEHGEAGCLPVATFIDEVVKASMGRTHCGNTPPLAGLSTGLPSIDVCTRGLGAGSLNVIAGRPAMGTTSLALNIAQHVALKQRRSVAIFSLHHTGHDIAERFLFAVGGIDRSRYDRGLLGAHERGALEAARKTLEAAPIHIDGTSFRLAEIGRQCRRLKDRLGDLGLIVIDPLHILLDAEADDSDARAVIHGVKSLAEDIGAAVLLTTTVSRRVENRKGARRVPSLTDVPEYSVLADVADLVLAVYREEYYKPGKHNAGDAQVHVLRHRFRACGGGVPLRFDGACGLFSECFGHSAVM